MKILIVIILCIITPLQAKESEDSRLAIHLLDYLASDYSGAVKNGIVQSASEYEEQLEFSGKIVTILTDYQQKNLLDKGLKLRNFIENKKEANDVLFLARSLQRELIKFSGISFAPEIWPSIKRGAELYQTHCLNCHGAEGMGNGKDGLELTPPPANFHKLERMNKISAFHCYNTIRLGVAGTGMAGFDKLEDKQIWDLSFYVMSLPFSKSDSSESLEENQLSLKEISILTNNEIQERFSLKDDKMISALRTQNHQQSFEDYLDIAHKTLNEVLPTYIHGEKDLAKKYAIQAYLQGIEPIEPAIKANKPELIISIEVAMSEIRKLVSQNGNELKLKIEIDKVESLFRDIKETLTNRKLNFSVALLGTYGIVLREGLEAVLLLVTLLGIVGAMKNKKAIRYIHLGWTTALGLGFFMWFISGKLINVSGVGREMLESFTALIAVIALLYFGFWLHQKTEITKWKTFIHEKINSAINEKNLFTLFSISFMAVFREAFETVLFIRSIWFQTTAADKSAIPYGVFLSLLTIAILAYFMLRYSKKIPMRKLFQISSFMMTTLAIILTGKAIHSFQEIGFLPIHTTALNFRFEILGIFPVWEGILAQMLLCLFMYILFFSGKNLKKIG